MSKHLMPFYLHRQSDLDAKLYPGAAVKFGLRRVRFPFTKKQLDSRCRQLYIPKGCLAMEGREGGGEAARKANRESS